jgi:hypothetical protein
MDTDYIFVRNLLLAVESHATDPATPLTKDQLGFSKIPDGLFYRQVIHFDRAKLMETVMQKSDLVRICFPTKLTESGRQFLESIRDEEVWARILDINNGEVATFSLSVLMALAERVNQLNFKKED